GSGLISSLDVPGLKLSIKNLINLMMMISDNSATDILLTKVGADNVNKRLRRIGIHDITVSRTCQHLILDFGGIDYDKDKDYTLQEVRELYQERGEEAELRREEARKRFNIELRDVSTPRAMNTLLEKIFVKKILDDESCDFIISVMLKCDTGGDRIKGLLPSRTQVAHKTGTIGGTVNDAGIIYLPDDLGHVALTVFTKETKAGHEKVAHAIAQIAKLVYDYFLFTL
ncbi:MAG: serine hydrolase, partial [Promethearchaeota archaeon]